MCTCRRAVAILALACGLPGCNLDLDLGLTGADFAIPTTQCLDATEWAVLGFERADVLDGEAVLLPIGHSRSLLANPVVPVGVVGCDEAVVSVGWRSTPPGVVDLAPGPGRQARLTGLGLGETVVSAAVTLTDGRTISAPLTWNGLEYPVRVIEGAPPPEGRQLLLDGAVGLEAESRCCIELARAYLVFDVPAAGSLDMFVDWGSASNQVIAHMCRGETGFPLGCVPIIDGTRHMGAKPVSASTHTTPGPHTLWITNVGPEADTVRYQVGLIPDGATAAAPRSFEAGSRLSRDEVHDRDAHGHDGVRVVSSSRR